MVLPEVAIQLNYCVEQIVILNNITQYRSKVTEDDRNKTVNFHRLEESMEESVSKFQSVFKSEQLNGGPQKKTPTVRK